MALKGKGKGGRNQEVALGALKNLGEDALVLACATDGVDNGPVAGALVDAAIRQRAARLRLRPDTALARNDSHLFFSKAGGHIKTGMTGANVSDLFIAMRAKPGKIPPSHR